MRRAELLKNSAEDVLRGHRPTRMEIKCSNMQHETLSNDLAPWHVSRCLRYGSSRERFFLSRLEKIRKRFVVADEKEEEEHVSMSDRAKYRSMYLILTDTICRRYLHVEPIPAMPREISQAERGRNVSTCRCSYTMFPCRANYRECGITGLYRDRTVTHERN